MVIFFLKMRTEKNESKLLKYDKILLEKKRF